MDARVLKRIRAMPQTHGPYVIAEASFLTEQGREPNDLWELVAFLEAEWGDRQLVKEVRAIAIKYERQKK